MKTLRQILFAFFVCGGLGALTLSRVCAGDELLPDPTIFVHVCLDNQMVPVQYESGLDVSGYCLSGDGVELGNPMTCDGSEVVVGGSLTIHACKGDDLTLTINPLAYGPAATVEQWMLYKYACQDTGGAPFGAFSQVTFSPPSGYYHMYVYLVSTPPETRDPVTARWNPDAGRRGGDDLVWGPAWLRDRSQVTDVLSEDYPALLYAGEAFEKQVDLAVPGRGLDFVFSRVHRSGEPEGGGASFGGQWTHNFDITATVPSATTLGLPINVTLGNGQTVTFRSKYNDSNTRFFYAEGWDAELRHEFVSTTPPAPGHLELVFGDGVKWVFPEFNFSNALGSIQRIESINDRFGNKIELTYDENDGRLLSITDTMERVYTLSYVSGKDLVASLTENNGLGRVISYGYDVTDRLVSVTYPATAAFPSPDQPQISYAYDTEGRLTTVTDARGCALLTNTYTDGVLTAQTHGAGADAATVSFEYPGLGLDPGETNAVSVTDCAGHVTEHYFNARQQLARLVRLDEAGEPLETTRITWEEHAFAGSTMVSDDLPDMVTLPDGIVVDYAYTGPGATSAYYKYRMQPVSITRTGTDGKALVEQFGHNGPDGFWDARFGDTFVTCHSLRDGDGTLLGATSRTYSSDGKATLDGMDYYGIAPYAGDPFGACGFTLQGAPTPAGQTFDAFLAADALYSAALGALADASVVYLPEAGTSPAGVSGEVMAAAPEDHHESFGYNAQGQIVEHLYPDNDVDGDPSDRVRRLDTFTYFTNGYLEKQIVDSGDKNLTTVFARDAVGRVTGITDPGGNATTLTYDHLDQVLTVVSPELASAADKQPTTTLAYDKNGNLILVRRNLFDSEGGEVTVSGETNDHPDMATEYRLDSRNRVTRVARESDPGLTSLETAYDGNGNVTLLRSPLAVDGAEPDNVTEYVYDTRDLPVRVVRGRELVTRLDYDAGGRPTRTIEGYGTAEARVTVTEYDGLGHVRRTVDAAGLVTEQTADALGRVTRVDRKDGAAVLARTEYDYDLPGRLTETRVLHRNEDGIPIGDGWLRTALAHTDAGMLLSETVEGADTTLFAYDSAMRLAAVTSPGGNRREYVYDANGNLTGETEAAWNTQSSAFTRFVTRREYDELNRLVSVSRDDDDGVITDAKKTLYAYDSLDRLVTETDPVGNVTANSYDALGRLTGSVHDSGGVNAAVTYTHDANGRLVSVTDPNGNVTGRAYDRFDRLVRVAFADGQEESFAYDAVGNVTAHRAPGGMATATAYDGMGRPTARTVTQLSGRAYPGTASFRYDALGRLVEARDDDSTVTRTYDTLGNPVEESVQAGTAPATRLRRTYDNRGRLATLDPPGDGNALSCARNADGLVTGVSRNTSALAAYGYLGPRPVLRTLTDGATSLGGTVIGYEATGDRPAVITHANAASTTVDARTYTWDKADNLTGWQITGWTPPTASATLGYDGLNRLAPPGTDWALDAAGNRVGADYYEFEGGNELMHRYTEVNNLARYYDTQGALLAGETSAGNLQFYHYDVDDRLDAFREIAPASAVAFSPLNRNDGNWTEISGTWVVNDNGTSGDLSDDYLEETSAGAGAIVYAPTPLPEYGFTVQYRSSHDPADPDGDLTPGEYDGDDYPAKYYAQIVLLVEMKDEAPDPYAALRIEPDRLVFVLCYDGQLWEVDGVKAETKPDTWYTVKFWHTAGGPGDAGSISVARFGDSPGDSVSMVLNIPRDDPPGPAPIGFTVGEAAHYQFRLIEQATAPDALQASVLWTHDVLGRRVSETVCGAAGAVVSKTLYVWDGWRLVAELDARENNRVVAEYVPGPGYVDETVAVRRDLNRDGDFDDANEGFLYPLADQQHSTVALLNASGTVVERYGYDAFGTPSFYDGAGNALAGGSAVGNTTLYTGRTWMPALGLYDYRQRLYDPAVGRFLTPDPAQDPANLGNPYTYTANNPHAFVDPYGLETVRDLYGNDISALSERIQQKLVAGQRCELNARMARSGMAAQAEKNFFGMDVLDANAPIPDYAGGYRSLVAGKNTALAAAGNAVAIGTLPLTGPAQIVADSLFVMSNLSGDSPSYVNVGLTVLGIGAMGRGLRSADDAAEVTALKQALSNARATDSLGIINEIGGQRGFAFETFGAFKRYWGSAGPGREWHHIVERNREAQFGATAVHNVYNVVSVPAEVNRSLGSLYSSIQRNITGRDDVRVRDWLAPKSYEEQRAFGLWAMEQVTRGMLP